jgi:threonine-phosphate decarboxylase
MRSASPTLPPVHGGQLRQIAARYGVHAERLVDFSANINPAGAPASVMKALQQALAAPATLVAYPDLELTELKMALATSTSVQPENIAVANGFVPLLEAALRSLKIERCLLPVPSFGEYRRTLENVGAAVVPYFLSQEGNFRYEPDALLHALLEGRCDALLLANPQNPSGILCDVGQMQRLIERATQRGVTVLLDEAFIDYVPAQSLLRLAIEKSNLVVFRSVTKFFAIPGLRVAYAVGSASFVRDLNRSIAPWPVTTFASDAVCAALQDEAYAKESRLANDEHRAWLELALAKLAIATYGSSTNFLLLRFPVEVDVHLLWERMIVEEQIVLRSCTNFEGLAAGHLRSAVRSDSENERLIRGLERVLVRMKEELSALARTSTLAK